MSDLGANWDLGSIYGCKHLTQVAPKTDNSILYFSSFTVCSQPFTHFCVEKNLSKNFLYGEKITGYGILNTVYGILDTQAGSMQVWWETINKQTAILSTQLLNSGYCYSILNTGYSRCKCADYQATRAHWKKTQIRAILSLKVEVFGIWRWQRPESSIGM